MIGVPPHVARGLTDNERDLEFLLAENYEFLTGESGENCARQALNYIRSLDTIAGKDIDFVKKLTKVADHISSAFFDRERQKVHPQVCEWLRRDYYRTFFSDWSKDTCGFLEKLYTFNLKGAETADSLRGKDELRPEENLTRQSHFLAYAGNAARRLFSIIGYKGEGIMWANEVYNCYTRSAKIAEKPEPRHAAYAYTHAAEAAEKIYETTGDIQWLVNTYNSFKDSARLAVTAGEIKHAVYAYNEAASAASKIYSKSQDKEVKATVETQRNLCLKLSAELQDKMYLSEQKPEQNEWQR